MRLPATDLARAWLSVAQASGTKDDVPALAKTVAIEEFDHGLRLVATDRHVLLSAWVDADRDVRTEPAIDEAPNRTVIAADHDGRGKSLCGYILSLAARQDDEDAELDPMRADVIFDVRMPAGDDRGEMALEGLEPSYVVLSVPDVERVYLRMVEDTFPDWRQLVLGFEPETTKAVALNPEITERLSKLRKWHTSCPLVWRFGGSDRPAAIDVGDSEPHVSGLVMPMRWVFPGEEPEGGEAS